MTRLVFVPGFMQRGDTWAAVAERLPRGHEFVLIDHDAHDREGRLAEIAGAGEGAVLCGYSLGGRLALLAAVRDPDRYRGLVTVGTSAGLESSGERALRSEADERLAAWIETAPIEDVVAVWERQPIFADQPEKLIERQRPGRLSCEPRDLAMLLRTAGQGVSEPVWDRLTELELPLLALAGARDERYLVQARRMADLAPDGRFAAVEGAGHAAHLEQPEAVAALIAAFVA